MNIYGQAYKQLPLITAPKIHTDLLWDLSFLFVGLAIVYFICVFFFRNRISARGEKEKQRKRELSPMISEFLFHEEEASKDEKSNYVNLKIEIRQLLKDDFNRRIIAEVLLDLRKDVAGDTQKRLFKLYQDLGLHQDDFKKLKSWRWEIVSKGILNLTQMQVAEAYSFVTKFINDKRATIRKQAEIAVVTLKPEGINYFLDTTKYKISEWQQLKLLDVLRNEEDYQPPRFKAWLTSTNRHVVLFALRLIKFYNQNDANAALIELVKHKNSQIKQEAIGCIKEFYILGAIPMLKLVFWKSSTDVKISILDALGALGSDSDIEFLELIEKKEANFSVRSKAHSSINAIAPDSIMPSKGLLNTSNYKIPNDLKTEVKEESDQQDEIDTDYASNTSNLNTPDAIGISEELPLDAEISEALRSSEVIPNIGVETPKETPAEEAQSQGEEIFMNDSTPNESVEQPKEMTDKEDTSDATDEHQGPVIQPGTTEENETLCFDFLPLVIQEALDTKTDDSDKEDSNSQLNQMLVIFEEVTADEGVEPQKKETFSIEIKEEEIAFLPIVTDEMEEFSSDKTSESPTDIEVSIEEIEVQFEEVDLTTPDRKLRPTTDYSEYRTFEILDAHVIYDEITGSSIEISERDIKHPTDPYFLSVLPEPPPEDTLDVKSNATPQTSQPFDDMTPQDEQKFKKIITDLIDFNELQQSEETTQALKNLPLFDFGVEFIDANQTSESTEDTQEEPAADSQGEVEEKDQENLTIPTSPIPKAILSDDVINEDILNEEIFDEIILYKENTEESRMQLLDDIAEMGDQREIPLLTELLVNEKYKTVKDRVKRLIEQFSEAEEKPEPETLLKPFNVFEDLFRTCDTEAKLILMDEIVAVGDEAEIDFLESLLENEEMEISNKAARLLEELKAKLSTSNSNQTAKTLSTNSDKTTIANKETLKEEATLAAYDSMMEELQIEPPQTSGIFDVDFELTEPLHATVENSIKGNKPSENSANKESFLGQICAFSNKIIDKLNG